MCDTDGTYIDTIEELGDAPWQPPRNSLKEKPTVPCRNDCKALTYLLRINALEKALLEAAQEFKNTTQFRYTETKYLNLAEKFRNIATDEYRDV